MFISVIEFHLRISISCYFHISIFFAWELTRDSGARRDVSRRDIPVAQLRLVRIAPRRVHVLQFNKIYNIVRLTTR